MSIVRDPWGIAHVYGRSDADAVFGAIYDGARQGHHDRVVLTYCTGERSTPHCAPAPGKG